MITPAETFLAKKTLDLLKSAASKAALEQGKKLTGLDGVSKAIRATCKAEGDDQLKTSLEAWLTSPDFESFLQMQSTGLIDEAVVDSFVGVLRHTKYPAADSALARRVLTSFFAAWHSEQLKGDNAAAIADTLSALRDQKTVDVIKESSETLRQDIAGVTAKLEALAAPAITATKEELAARSKIEAAKHLLETRRPGAARKLLETVENVGRLPFDVRVSYRMTLGVSALRSGDLAGSRSQFEAVLTDKPGDHAVLTNLSVVAAREKRVDAAVAYAEKAFEKSSNDRGTRVNYALALWHAGDNSEALTILGDPSEWTGDAELLVVVAQAYANLGQPKAMEEIARRALAHDATYVDALVLAATAIIAADEDDIHEPSRARLEEACALLTKALELIDGEGDELRELQVQALTNRAAVYGHLGAATAGIADCKAALAIDADATQARRNLALFYLEQGNTTAAHDELLVLKGTDIDDAARILLARITLDRGDANAALDELRPLLEVADHERFYAAADLALKAYKLIDDERHWIELVDKLEHLATKSASAAAILAIHISESDFASSVERLQHAINRSQGIDRTRLTIVLADLYYRQKRFGEASLLYSSAVSDRLDRKVLRRYIIAEFNSGNWGAVATYAARLRGDGRPIETITEIEARVYELTGQAERARDLYDQLDAAYPKDPSYRLQLIASLLRSGLHAEGKQRLADISIDTLATADSLLMAGSLRRQVGLPDALEYYYRALRVDFDDEETQAAYIEAFVALESDTPTTVEIGCEVVIAEGEETRTWAIVPLPADVHQPGEFAASTAPGNAVIGRRVGDTVDVGGTIRTITEIRSKYASMWRRLFREFRDRFPASPHVRFGNDPEELIEELKAGGRRAEALRTLYRRGAIGIGALADLTNRSTIETWAFLYFSPDEQLRASSGKAGILNRQIASLEEKRTVLLDLTALCTIVELGITEVVAAAFNRVLIAQRTREEIEILLAKERQPLGQAILMASDRARVHSSEAVAARQQARLEYIERIARFAQEFLSEVASPGIAEITAEMRTRMGKRIGNEALASASAAASEGAVWCSDDLVGQETAEWGWNVQCASTLAILRYLHKHERLTTDEFRRRQHSLLDARYFFVPTSVDELYEVLVDAAFLPTVEVIKHLTTLRGPDCDEDAAVNVLADIVRKVWLSGTLFSRDTIIDLAAATVRYGRNPGRSIMKLRRAIYDRFLLMPQYFHQIDQSLQAWQHQNALLTS